MTRLLLATFLFCLITISASTVQDAPAAEPDAWPGHYHKKMLEEMQALNKQVSILNAHIDMLKKQVDAQNRTIKSAAYHVVSKEDLEAMEYATGIKGPDQARFCDTKRQPGQEANCKDKAKKLCQSLGFKNTVGAKLDHKHESAGQNERVIKRLICKGL